MVDLWFSSDFHFRHNNILTFKDKDGNPIRPFSSVKEMDQVMIERHNELVKPPHHFYCLGDVSMMRPRFVHDQVSALQGHKRLVRGNHDIAKTKEYMEYWDEIYGVRVIDRILFSHYPVHPSNLGPYVANCHGHIHQNPSPPPHQITNPKTGEVRVVPYINLSVERIDYRPVNLEWIKGEIERLKNVQTT